MLSRVRLFRVYPIFVNCAETCAEQRLCVFVLLSKFESSSPLVIINLPEECLSGLRCFVGNEVCGNAPQVRILSPPPIYFLKVLFTDTFFETPAFGLNAPSKKGILTFLTTIKNRIKSPQNTRFNVTLSSNCKCSLSSRLN